MAEKLRGSHDSKSIVNNSKSADILAATQHKTNPSSDDENRAHHWAIEQGTRSGRWMPYRSRSGGGGGGRASWRAGLDR